MANPALSSAILRQAVPSSIWAFITFPKCCISLEIQGSYGSVDGHFRRSSSMSFARRPGVTPSRSSGAALSTLPMVPCLKLPKLGPFTWTVLRDHSLLETKAVSGCGHFRCISHMATSMSPAAQTWMPSHIEHASCAQMTTIRTHWKAAKRIGFLHFKAGPTSSTQRSLRSTQCLFRKAFTSQKNSGGKLP